MNAGGIVTNCRDEGKNWKFCSDVTGFVPRPVDLWIGKLKPVLIVIVRNGGDVALPPAPLVDKGLIDRDEPNNHGDNADSDCHVTISILRCAHESRLDKPHEQSQSSTVTGIPMRAAVFTFGLLLVLAGATSRGQDEPTLVPDVVDYKKLLPLLPEAPSGWKADKPEGSTADVGGFKLTNVHRDYRKGEGDKVPTAAISILDSAANPDYVEATTAAWNFSTTSTEGYSKAVTVDGNPGFETFENEGKHGTLWIMVAKRYFLQIETQQQEPAALQEWAKRVDVKKLAAIK